MCDGAHEDHRDNLKLHLLDTIHVVFVFSFYEGGSLTGASQADQSGWPASPRNLPSSYFLVTELQNSPPSFLPSFLICIFMRVLGTGRQACGKFYSRSYLPNHLQLLF